VKQRGSRKKSFRSSVTKAKRPRSRPQTDFRSDSWYSKAVASIGISARILVRA